MKLASLKAGGRDGTLIVVDRSLTRFLPVPDIAPTLQQAIDELNQVAEGVPNARNAYELSRKLGVRTPLIDQAYEVIHKDKPCALALRELLSRNPRSESD